MKVLITGITGQDGSYLSEKLLLEGHEVHGLVRRVSTFNTSRIDHLLHDPDLSKRLHLHYGDLLDFNSIISLVESVRPRQIYHLGAQSHVSVSFRMPTFTTEVNTLGVINILEAVRQRSIDSTIYIAGSSEMFGNEPAPQGLTTKFSPVSPYAISKVSGFHLGELWRNSYKMNVIQGILFNHESFRRGENFVTKKIVKNAVRIRNEVKSNMNTKKILPLKLGNLQSRRDWGWAPEFMSFVNFVCTNGGKTNFVLGTGVSATIESFAIRVFKNLDLEMNDWIEIDDSYKRPTEVHNLHADLSSINDFYQWRPKITWQELCDIMCEEELRQLESPVKWQELGPANQNR